jgi:hypothetical protein
MAYGLSSETTQTGVSDVTHNENEHNLSIDMLEMMPQQLFLVWATIRYDIDIDNDYDRATLSNSEMS